VLAADTPNAALIAAELDTMTRAAELRFKTSQPFMTVILKMERTAVFEDGRVWVGMPDQIAMGTEKGLASLVVAATRVWSSSTVPARRNWDVAEALARDLASPHPVSGMAIDTHDVRRVLQDVGACHIGWSGYLDGSCK